MLVSPSDGLSLTNLSNHTYSLRVFHGGLRILRIYGADIEKQVRDG